MQGLYADSDVLLFVCSSVCRLKLMAAGDYRVGHSGRTSLFTVVITDNSTNFSCVAAE